MQLKQKGGFNGRVAVQQHRAHAQSTTAPVLLRRGQGPGACCEAKLSAYPRLFGALMAQFASAGGQGGCTIVH